LSGQFVTFSAKKEASTLRAFKGNRIYRHSPSARTQYSTCIKLQPTHIEKFPHHAHKKLPSKRSGEFLHSRAEIKAFNCTSDATGCIEFAHKDKLLGATFLSHETDLTQSRARQRQPCLLDDEVSPACQAYQVQHLSNRAEIGLFDARTYIIEYEAAYSEDWVPNSHNMQAGAICGCCVCASCWLVHIRGERIIVPSSALGILRDDPRKWCGVNISKEAESTTKFRSTWKLGLVCFSKG